MEGKHRDRTLLQDTDQTAQPRADKAREREKSVGREVSIASNHQESVHGPAWGKKQRFQDGILIEEDNSGAKTALSQQEIPPPRRRRRQQLRQQHDEQPEPKKGNDNSALRLRLDLNLDIEIELKAKIHGDITLTLLN